VEPKPFSDLPDVSGIPEKHMTDFGKRVNEHRDREARWKEGAGKEDLRETLRQSLSPTTVTRRD
jgi:hypothetical protein